MHEVDRQSQDESEGDFTGHDVSSTVCTTIPTCIDIHNYFHQVWSQRTVPGAECLSTVRKRQSHRPVVPEASWLWQ